MARPCFLCHTRLTTWATTRHLGTTPACGLRRPPNPSDTQAGPTVKGDPEGHPSPEARPLTGQDPSAPTRPSCLSSAGHRTARHRLCRPDPTAAGSPQARAPRRAQILKGNTEGRSPEEEAAAVKRGAAEPRRQLYADWKTPRDKARTGKRSKLHALCPAPLGAARGRAGRGAGEPRLGGPLPGPGPRPREGHGLGQVASSAVVWGPAGGRARTNAGSGA